MQRVLLYFNNAHHLFKRQTVIKTLEITLGCCSGIERSRLHTIGLYDGSLLNSILLVKVCQLRTSQVDGASDQTRDGVLLLISGGQMVLEGDSCGSWKGPQLYRIGAH